MKETVIVAILSVVLSILLAPGCVQGSLFVYMYLVMSLHSTRVARNPVFDQTAQFYSAVWLTVPITTGPPLWRLAVKTPGLVQESRHYQLYRPSYSQFCVQIGNYLLNE